MEYISSANDIMYAFEGTLTYYIECEGNVVYWGKAQEAEGSINITRCIRDYLETDMPDFRDFNGVIVPHPKQLRTFYLREASGSLLETYTVLLESTGEWSVFGPITEPINRRADPRQKIFWTTVEESGNTYDSNTKGGEYSGETDTGDTEYYFNYTTPTSQAFSATTTSTTISWETNYGDIYWSVYDVVSYGMVSSGVSSSDSVIIVFPGNTGDTNIAYEFRAYSVLDGSYLGSVFWDVSSPQDTTNGSTTGTTYSFTPTYTTAYTDGSDVIWNFQTDCPDPLNLFIYSISAAEGFSISVDERGSSYTRIKINSLPTQTGKTASCSIRIKGYGSQGEIGHITIINKVAQTEQKVNYFTIEPLSSVTKVLACAVLKDTGSTASLHYRINGGIWKEQTFSGLASKYGGNGEFEHTVTLTNGEVIEKIEFFSVKNSSTYRYYIEPYSDDYHYLPVEYYNGSSWVNTMSVPYKASGDYASLVYGESITARTTYSAFSARFKTYSFKGEYWSNSITLYDAEDMVFPNVGLQGTYEGMFSDCVNLKIPPKELSSTSVGFRSYLEMFSHCYSLEKMPYIKFDGNVPSLTFEAMFYLCKNLRGNVSLNFNKIIRRSLSLMFEGANISSVDLKIDNIDNLEATEDGDGGGPMDRMFLDCKSLKHFSLSPYKGEKVVIKNMELGPVGMGGLIFKGCTGLETAYLAPLYFESTIYNSGQDIANIFSGCTSLGYVNMHLERLFSMSGAFQGCVNLTNIDLYCTFPGSYDPQYVGTTQWFLDGASPTGTITINRDCPITPGSIPSGWTINYSD